MRAATKADNLCETFAERHEGAVTVFARGPVPSPGLELLAADHAIPSP